ncbi:TIGR04282 family arsenosugar biosynthesis glycosyltransferase [Actomonas aquatica]|uniref:TIGR04282 family arsenosugar biosynthesis glycosyltransferase n=1 Tax=Actomonas aquatica TaxID=2866162 RepID=A0ABZ1C6E2_9BACT|nr:TIGR04282 family arsenosugar biosynthesis glycosyltransferase [Opitutus sp. WL0086]WRQ86930.1 TIGR04282 family arsenosugar biosynthesis glycosyltransferase [Opitutus sp. WL0086]
MKPTVLMFVKAPVLGAVKTRLAATVGDDEALRAHCWLVQRQVSQLPADWPLEVHYAPGTEAAEAQMREWLGEADGRTFWPQPEEDLGGRLRAATAAAFGREAEAVLLIGGDCPELDEAGLRDAARALERAPVVLGPARDGGYYLLGMRRPRLELLDGIAWSTSEVAAQTRARADEAGVAVAELPMRGDVDTAEDWAPWAERLR